MLGLQGCQLQRPKSAGAGCSKARRGLWDPAAGWGLLLTQECQHVVTAYPGLRKGKERKRKQTYIFFYFSWSLRPATAARRGGGSEREGDIWKFTSQRWLGKPGFKKERKRDRYKVSISLPPTPFHNHQALLWSLSYPTFPPHRPKFFLLYMI